ncbi:MAG: hypothetical protein H0T91_11560, partial [Propionibacteriaceae bacterium]|nr:hypothetical protein [Propionibacteriaceae bacterium]
MTQTVAARPVPLSRVWSHNKIIADDLQGDDLGDVLELHSEASAWWVLPRQHEEVSIQLRDAASALDLDDLAMKDLVAEDRRATFEELGHARLVTTNAVILDRQTAELTVHAVSMVTTDRAMICLVDPVGDEFNPAHLLAKKSDQLADGGVECALQLVLGAVISTYENAVEWLEDSNDQLANALFEERPLNKFEQLWA